MIEFMIYSESWLAYLLWLILVAPAGLVIGAGIFYPIYKLVNSLFKKEK